MRRSYRLILRAVFYGATALAAYVVFEDASMQPAHASPSHRGGLTIQVASVADVIEKATNVLLAPASKTPGAVTEPTGRSTADKATTPTANQSRRPDKAAAPPAASRNRRPDKAAAPPAAKPVVNKVVAPIVTTVVDKVVAPVITEVVAPVVEKVVAPIVDKVVTPDCEALQPDTTPNPSPVEATPDAISPGAHTPGARPADNQTGAPPLTPWAPHNKQPATATAASFQSALLENAETGQPRTPTAPLPCPAQSTQVLEQTHSPGHTDAAPPSLSWRHRPTRSPPHAGSYTRLNGTAPRPSNTPT